MTGPRPDATQEQREFDDIAAGLYALRTDAFAAARDAAVRGARAEGRKQIAGQLSQLRRPAQGAWLINLLWRNQRELMEQFLTLPDEMTSVLAEGSVEALHRLSAQRRELEGALIRHAYTLAHGAGVEVSASMGREVRGSLAAALASPEVAEEVRTGRLVKPASYAGFGMLPESSPPRPFQPAANHTKPAPAASPPPAKRDRSGESVSEAARERREAESRRLEEAREAVKTAAGELSKQGRLVDAARQDHQRLLKHVEHLREQVLQARAEAATAERTLLAAQRDREKAEKAHAAALRKLESAEQPPPVRNA